MIIADFKNGYVARVATWQAVLTLLATTEDLPGQCDWRGVNAHEGVSGSGLVSLRAAAVKAITSDQIRTAAEKARALIGPALPGERTDLIAKAETAERIANGNALPGDYSALEPEAADRGESVEMFAALVVAKARWARIMALEISRLVNLVSDEIEGADLSTNQSADRLLANLSGFESDLRLAIADMQAKARIAYASAKLLLLNPEKDSPECWTASGKPAVDKLSELVGFEVTAAQRDAVWEIEGK